MAKKAWESKTHWRRYRKNPVTDYYRQLGPTYRLLSLTGWQGVEHSPCSQLLAWPMIVGKRVHWVSQYLRQCIIDSHAYCAIYILLISFLYNYSVDLIFTSSGDQWLLCILLYIIKSVDSQVPCTFKSVTEWEILINRLCFYVLLRHGSISDEKLYRLYDEPLLTNTQKCTPHKHIISPKNRSILGWNSLHRVRQWSKKMENGRNKEVAELDFK